MEDLVGKAAVELWAWPEVLRLEGSLSARSLGSVERPKRLKELVLVALETVRWSPFL